MLTGKTAELVDLLLFPCLMDAWGCPWGTNPAMDETSVGSPLVVNWKDLGGGGGGGGGNVVTSCVRSLTVRSLSAQPQF